MCRVASTTLIAFQATLIGGALGNILDQKQKLIYQCSGLDGEGGDSSTVAICICMIGTNVDMCPPPLNVIWEPGACYMMNFVVYTLIQSICI